MNSPQTQPVHDTPRVHARNPETIRSMFGSIASRYDVANSVLSLGIHHLWRRALVKWSAVQPADRVLDVATGTGDVAFTFRSRKETPVVGMDFSFPMVKEATKKARERNVAIPFGCGDALHLPFPDQSFDVVSISFGIRNVQSSEGALREFARVLRPGGRLLVLEFGMEQKGWFGVLFRWYSRNLLPLIGGIVSGKPAAYRYLQTSAAAFPCGEDFVNLIQSTGFFGNAEFKTLTGGIAYLYRAVRR